MSQLRPPPVHSRGLSSWHQAGARAAGRSTLATTSCASHRQAQRLWLCADRPTTTAVHSCISTPCPFCLPVLVAPAAGRTRISLRRTGELYSHVPPSAKVHNLVLGKTWIDSFGSFHVRNVNTGVRVEMEFKPCGWFGSNQYEFEGLVLDEQVRAQGSRDFFTRNSRLVAGFRETHTALVHPGC